MKGKVNTKGMKFFGLYGVKVEPAAHTPTPWAVKEKTTHTTLYHLGEHIADVVRSADAAFIVKAVNCHEELTSSLKTVVKELGDQMQGAFRVYLKDLIAKAEEPK